MCRVFGFRSILQSGVHQSLIDADNAIVQQSDRHPDGWGVAYYKMGSPHLIKMDGQARESHIFKKVSGVVSSNTVMAHIRKSTVGEMSPLNTHPFQFGRWVFAHNGNVQNFSNRRQAFMANIDKDLASFILGETDSEVLFYFILSIMKKQGYLENFEMDEDSTQRILDEFVEKFQNIAGPLSESKGDYDKNYLTFLLSNGDYFLGFNGGQSLLYSTHKKRCPERASCSYFKEICESPARKEEKVHHLLISSEVIQNENIWNEMEFGSFVGVQSGLKFFKGKVLL